MLREAGAAEVHVRIASPPVRWPCFYGIDFASRAELIATGSMSRGSALDRCRLAGLRLLEGLIAATKQPGYSLCRRASTASTRSRCPRTTLIGKHLLEGLGRASTRRRGASCMPARRQRVRLVPASPGDASVLDAVAGGAEGALSRP